MNPVHDEEQFKKIDQLVMTALQQPVASEITLRLQRQLADFQQWIDSQSSTVAQRISRTGRRKWAVRVAAMMLATSVLIAITTIPRRPRQPDSGRYPAANSSMTATVPAEAFPANSQSLDTQPSVNPPPAVDPQAPVLVGTTPAVESEFTEIGYGDLAGQVVLQGPVPSPHPPLVKANLKDVSSAAGCGQVIPDESLLVDSTTSGLANVFVFVTNPGSVHPSLKPGATTPVTFDATCGRFVPHAFVALTGQTINVRSLDPFAYNVLTRSMKNRQHNFIVQATPVALTLPVAERMPFPITDEIHPWMRAYCLVLGHPYAVVTNRAGRFRLRKLPVGSCTVQVWHERVGLVRKNVTVEVRSQETTDWGVIAVTASQLRS